MPDESFASKTILEVRRAVTEALLAQADAIMTGDVDGLVQKAKTFDLALRADPSSSNARGLLSGAMAQLQLFLRNKVRRLEFTEEVSAGRVVLSTYTAAADLVAGTVVFSAPNDVIGQAYPALTASLRVEDARSCLPSAERVRLQSEVENVLKPVARLVPSGGDIEFRVTNVSCPRSDMPRQAVQEVNSTYVAGQTQLANPEHVQLQSSLASAEANLSRAYAANQANPNFATGFAYGAALGEVRKLRNALASTPPYTASEILQAYQYQKF